MKVGAKYQENRNPEEKILRHIKEESMKKSNTLNDYKDKEAKF